MEHIDINEISGIRIGNAQDYDSATGCTVILCEKGAVAGVDVRGGAPGTRETDLLNPVNLVDKVHSVLLSGGSAFGLDAASGIMSYLESRGIGFDVGVTKVPIVTGAVIFDLEVGDYRIRPDKKMGYDACVNSEKGFFSQGTVGAGTGASVGKVFGINNAMKGGLGACCLKIGELYVGAIIVVNCLGDVVEPGSGNIIAGTLDESGKDFINSENFIINNCVKKSMGYSGNTTIGVVFTNAHLSKANAQKVASMAHNGIARTIRPSHTMFDGDTIFALSLGTVEAEVSAIGVIAAQAVEEAIISGVQNAKGICNLKSVSDRKGIL